MEVVVYTILSQNTINLVSNIGANIGSTQQRALQGAVALGVQPAIDYNNKGTDDNTRAVSTARTIGKIVAGTIVGVLVRAGSIKALRKMAQDIPPAEIIDSKGLKKLKSLFTPKWEKLSKSLNETDRKALLESHVRTMGLILATLAMVFTNFLIDAPLTKIITKKLEPTIRTKINKQNEKNRLQTSKESVTQGLAMNAGMSRRFTERQVENDSI